MAANKRPPPKGPERPMLRTSHGAPGARGKVGSAKEGAERPARPARPAPERAPRTSAETRARASGGGAPSRRGAGGAAATAERAERAEDDGSRLKKTTGARVPGATSTASDESREVAILIAVAGIEKKASGLEVIDVAGRVDYADFLVLMSGRSDRHVTALASAIEETLRKRNKRALAVEGLPHANWVLMDFGDVVVHVFQDDARSAYDIDALWMDARRVPVPLGEGSS
ncbi:MAG: Iojap protein [Myxococcaceae bacterium]|nr:Iojap protein [Myxococcaceae bacterium]MEA2753119.1 ribosome-associated protein [Myxococcales bacterium]